MVNIQCIMVNIQCIISIILLTFVSLSEIYGGTVVEKNQILQKDQETTEDIIHGVTSCKNGYFGISCEPCTSIANCIGVVTCTSSTNQRCTVCAEGFRGTNCEVFDACASYPCSNGGTCEPSSGGYNCTCVPGVTGQNCEIAIDECDSSPCLNGGTCVEKLNSYECVCTPGYTGVNCQTNINECASVPCQNNGTCSDKVNGYTCACLTGYSGDNCQYEPCSFYFTEHVVGGAGGFISKVDEYGNVFRITSSGADKEQLVVSDGSLIFYTTENTNVWRVTADNPSSTRVAIWSRASGKAVGLGITKNDMRLFVDETVGNTIVMLGYEGNFYDDVSVGTATGWHRGLAADEVNRILYFTDEDNDCILSVSYSTTVFTGNVAIILSGTVVGDVPRGLVLLAEERKLYWILGNTREIRSVLIGSASSEVVVPADNTITGAAFGLVICGENFFHTEWAYGGGIWRASRGGGPRVQITKTNTLRTLGIWIAG